MRPDTSLCGLGLLALGLEGASAHNPLSAVAVESKSFSRKNLEAVAT
jgi:hypothetical protein